MLPVQMQKQFEFGVMGLKNFSTAKNKISLNHKLDFDKFLGPYR